jgi:glycerophosphoryl diester phosphodiesterase
MVIQQLLSKCDLLNIAHRGARSLAPENTLIAASKAFQVGAHMWELDVGMTRDEELLVIHDATLERTSNARTIFPSRSPWNVHDFTLEEIRRLDFGSWYERKDPFHQIRSGAVPPHELQSYSGLPAPTLVEALDLTRKLSWAVNVEIKDLSGAPGHHRVAQEVVALIEAMDMRESVIISSFNHSYLQEARRMDSAIHLGVLTNRRIPNPVKTLRELGALAYHPRLSALDPNEARQLRKEGFHVFAWVANDRETFLRLKQENVSGIFTDFPQDLDTFLKGQP